MDESIDFKALGVEPSYTKRQQHRLRRYLLEDWKASQQKLYTYCNLLSLQLSRKLPEDWLSKLIPQTMRKMFFNEHSPRYEFWACVHLYLKDKYPDQVDIHSNSDITQERLGHALSLFLNITDDHEEVSYYRFKEGTMRIEKQREQDFYGIVVFFEVIGKNAYHVKPLLGVAIKHDERLVGTARDLVTYAPHPIDILWDELETLDDTDVCTKLDSVGNGV